jgi:hypothetical protein
MTHATVSRPIDQVKMEAFSGKVGTGFGASVRSIIGHIGLSEACVI